MKAKRAQNKERSYKTKVILWTTLLLLIDEVTIGIPEADLILIAVVWFRPRWFLEMVHRLYQYVPHQRAWRPVKEVCRRQVVAVPATTTVAAAARLLRDRHERSLVVVEERPYLALPKENEKRTFGWIKRRKAKPTAPPPPTETILTPVGILTDRDIALKVGAEDLSGDTIAVAQIMETEFAVAFESEDIHSAVEKMREVGMRYLPVVDPRGHLVGKLSLDDAVAVLSDGLNDMVALLRQEIEQESSARPIQSKVAQLQDLDFPGIDRGEQAEPASGRIEAADQSQP
ncbi:hypothetical protein JCM13664_09080 [Methylothermus subterraneus]